MARFVYGQKTAAYNAASYVYNRNVILFNDIYSVFFGLNIADAISKKFKNGIGSVIGAATEIATNTVTSAGINAIMGILGFSYTMPSSIPLLEYEYSTQPYINRAMLSYAALKQDLDFTLRINAVVTRLAPFVIHQAKMEGFKAGLEYYTDRGGTFTIITPGGTLTPCVFVRLDMIGGLSGAPGTQYDISFKKVNLGSQGALSQLSQQLSMIKNGGIPQ